MVNSDSHLTRSHTFWRTPACTASRRGRAAPFSQAAAILPGNHVGADLRARARATGGPGPKGTAGSAARPQAGRGARVGVIAPGIPPQEPRQEPWQPFLADPALDQLFPAQARDAPQIELAELPTAIPELQPQLLCVGRNGGRVGSAKVEVYGRLRSGKAQLNRPRIESPMAPTLMTKPSLLISWTTYNRRPESLASSMIGLRSWCRPKGSRGSEQIARSGRLPASK